MANPEFCTILNCLFTTIPIDDCDSGWTAVVVDLAGNMTAIDSFDTEEEAEACAREERKRMLEEHSQFGVGA